MDILIQNKSETPYFLTVIRHDTGRDGKQHAGVGGRYTIEADNNTTKIPEEIYESRIKNNPFFQNLIERGVLVVLNDVGVKPHEAMAEAAAARELGFARYKTMVLNIEREGGVSNTEIAPYLDREGLPKLEFVRSTLGAVDPMKISEYRSRLIAERGANIGGLVIPGGKKPSSSSSNVNKEMQAIEEQREEAKAGAGEEDAGNEAGKPEKYDRAALEAMTREVLVETAKSLDLSFSNRISSDKLVTKILEEQDSE
jgi:hypothetical protein